MIQMNKYFFYHILLNLKRNIKQNIMLGFIVMFITIFMSFCHFFSFDTETVDNIANQLELNIEIKDNHIFDFKYEDLLKKFSIDKDYFNDFVETISDAGENDDILSYGFSINVTTHKFDEQNNNKGYISLSGIQNAETFEIYKKSLVNGRYLTEEEIDNGVPYAVVTDDQGFNVGDKIKIGNIVTGFEDESTINLELEIIGIVNTEKSNFIEYDIISKDRKVNGIFISNNILLDLINEDESFNDFSSVMIYNIYYQVKDYNHYSDSKQNLIKYFNDYDLNLESKGLVSSNLEIEKSNIEIIIESILRIHFVYQIIFVLSIILIMCLFLSVMNYIIKNKSNEIKIYKSLGQKRLLIIMHYVMSYATIAILFSILGIVIADFLSQNLYQIMISNGLELQSNLLSLTDIRYEAIQLVPSYNSIYENAITIILEVLIVLVISVFVIMHKVLRRKHS